MAKAIAIIADQMYDDSSNKMDLIISTVIKPTGGDTFPGTRLEIHVLVNGTETPQQLATAIENAIKAEILARFGVTLASGDIISTKFS